MSNVNGESLGEIIKNALREKGLNQSAIAKKMNVSKQVMNQIDRRKHFDLEFLQKLRDASGLDFTDYHFGKKPTEFHINNLDRSTVEMSTQQIEMALSIKLKADPLQISKMGELMMSIRKEATRLGFAIV